MLSDVSPRGEVEILGFHSMKTRFLGLELIINGAENLGLGSLAGGRNFVNKEIRVDVPEHCLWSTGTLSDV